MTDTGWQTRCPKGHASLRPRSSWGYYCRSCEKRYPGEPVDLTRDDPEDADAEGHGTVHALTATRRLFDVTGDTSTTARARDFAARPRAMSHALRDAEEMGFVERIDGSNVDRYRVRETALWMIRD